MQKAKAYRAITSKEREELILKYLPTVKQIAAYFKKKVPPQVEFQDLVGYGMIGLIEAVDNIDLNRNPNSYIKQKIKGAIYDHLRKMDFGTRRVRQMERRIKETMEKLARDLGRDPTDEEIARTLGISEEELYSNLREISASYLIYLEDTFREINESHNRTLKSNIKGPEEIAEEKQKEQLLKEAIEQLTDKEKTVIQLYFYEDLEMKEIAEILNLSISRISQIKNEAVKKIRNYVHARW